MLITPKGYCQCKGHSLLWDKDSWWCFARQRWDDAPRSASLQQCARGELKSVSHVETLVNVLDQAMQEVKPDVSAVFVPAQFAAKAILQAIEAEIPLVVSVAEHVPVHDMLRVHEVLRTQNKTRLVGPNCPGIIAPEQCRIGIMPYKQYSRGCVGIVSKSGTLSYEAVGATTKAGLGQSIVVGMGGDMLPGTVPHLR